MTYKEVERCIKMYVKMEQKTRPSLCNNDVICPLAGRELSVRRQPILTEYAVGLQYQNRNRPTGFECNYIKINQER